MRKPWLRHRATRDVLNLASLSSDERMILPYDTIGSAERQAADRAVSGEQAIEGIAGPRQLDGSADQR